MSDFTALYKARLSGRELGRIRDEIGEWRDEGKKPKKIVSSLQRGRKKLSEEWKAERVYRTESKRIETQETKDAAKKFHRGHFKILLERNACEQCRKASGGEKRIYTSRSVAGRDIVPVHPNCRCRLVIWGPNS